jgi:hexulose-6-phosphate isomerase
MPTTSSSDLTRRAFLAAGAVAAAGVALGVKAPKASAAARPHLKKSLMIGMVPGKAPDGKKRTLSDQLQIAADAGFESAQIDTIFDASAVKEAAAGASKAKIGIDSIVVSTHWGSPLTDPDPAVFEKTMEATRVSLQNAKDLGADMLLLVPGVVNPKVMYRDAWTRSLDRVKKLAEDAERIGITIGIENVWNKFLLSPMEMKTFIETVDSKRVRAWFDIGNVVLFGYSQDWIRTLGPLIARLHIKDFKSDTREFTPLQEGSVDWPEVMRALDEIKFEGVVGAEVPGGEVDYLRDTVVKRMEAIFAM